VKHPALVRLDVDLDAVTCRPATAGEVDAFARGHAISIVLDTSSATVREADDAEVDAFRRGHVHVTLASGRWLTVVRAFPPPNVVVQLELDEQRTIAFAEALGEAAADAWFAGTLDLMVAGS
jgi:hypothetical protein